MEKAPFLTLKLGSIWKTTNQKSHLEFKLNIQLALTLTLLTTTGTTYCKKTKGSKILSPHPCSDPNVSTVLVRSMDLTNVNFSAFFSPPIAQRLPQLNN